VSNCLVNCARYRITVPRYIAVWRSNSYEMPPCLTAENPACTIKKPVGILAEGYAYHLKSMAIDSGVGALSSSVSLRMQAARCKLPFGDENARAHDLVGLHEQQ
jgi:hypothetical protein